jgi:hypothetical protein
MTGAEGMYSIVLEIHSLIRWIYLAGIMAAAFRAWYGWRGKRAWIKLDDYLSLSLTIVADVQMLSGILLYLVFSPKTTGIWSDFYTTFYKASFQYFGVYHLFMMLVSVFLLHLLRKLNHSAAYDIIKFKRSLILVLLALMVTILAIPW